MRNHSSKYLTNCAAVNESMYYGLFGEMTYRKKDDIKSFKMIPTDKYVGHIYCDGSSVYASHSFTPDDIVEICPCMVIDKTALYSKDVREMVFETKPGQEYVIPMGYCQFYEISDGYQRQPNCSYEWDRKRNAIVIRSIGYIKQGELLVIDISK